MHMHHIYFEYTCICSLPECKLKSSGDDENTLPITFNVFSVTPVDGTDWGGDLG